jgi:protein transport protein SEC61 subunit gamma and related proteins
MSDQMKDLADIPKDFIKDGTQLINRCTKRTSLQFPRSFGHVANTL